MKPFKTLQEAADAVENLEKELMNKLSQAVCHFYINFCILKELKFETFISFQMPELHMEVVLSEDTLGCIEEEVVINLFYLLFSFY